tara:strand:+ start:113 stop:2695 length:2583 start_codon:yes stop_codon:yes gene_type:complete
MTTKNIVPRTGSDNGQIGTTSKHWSKGHFDELTASVGISASYLYGDGSNLTGLSGTPAGSTYQIQYNDAGAFGASSELQFDSWTAGNSTLSIGSLAPTRLSNTAQISLMGGTAGSLLWFYRSGGLQSKVWSSSDKSLDISGSTDILLRAPDGVGVGIDTSATPRAQLDVSGSTVFGSELTHTHTFTGSFHQTGSGATSFFKDTIDVTGNLTASGHVSASAFYGDGSGLTGVTTGTPTLEQVLTSGNIATTPITGSGLRISDIINTTLSVTADGGDLNLSSSANVNLNLAGGDFKVEGGAMKVGTSTVNVDISQKGNLSLQGVATLPIISSSFAISGAFFQGDGSGLTGVTGDWDGQHTGDAGITGSLTVTELTSSAITAPGSDGSLLYNDNGTLSSMINTQWDGSSGELTLPAGGGLKVTDDYTIDAFSGLLTIKAQDEVTIRGSYVELSGAHPTNGVWVKSSMSASHNISASAFYGDGSGLTGVTGDWDGQHTGDAGITGSLEVLGQISASLGITGSEIHAIGDLYVGDTGIAPKLYRRAISKSNSEHKANYLASEDYVSWYSAYGVPSLSNPMLTNTFYLANTRWEISSSNGSVYKLFDNDYAGGPLTIAAGDTLPVSVTFTGSNQVYGTSDRGITYPQGYFIATFLGGGNGIENASQFDVTLHYSGGLTATIPDSDKEMIAANSYGQNNCWKLNLTTSQNYLNKVELNLTANGGTVCYFTEFEYFQTKPASQFGWDFSGFTKYEDQALYKKLSWNNSSLTEVGSIDEDGLATMTRFKADNSSHPGAPSDGAFMYAVSGDMWVKNTSGVQTQISPHDENDEWQYFSKNTKTGKVVRIRMEKMIRKLEELTGETFIEEE